MYLNILIGTKATLASNNRGESDGNHTPLQTLTTGESVRTVVSGHSIRYAMRAALEDNGAAVWRKRNVNSTGSGYGYGTSNSPTMIDAPPATPESYDDTLLFGYMLDNKDKTGAKKSGAKAAASPAGKTTKASGKSGMTTSAAVVQVSAGISLTSFSGDQAFVRGLSSTKPCLMPFTYDRHYTRYQYTVTVDLNRVKLRPEALKQLLDILPYLQVGGNHSANAGTLATDKIVWRFSKIPGQGGWANTDGFDWAKDADASLSTATLETSLARLGVTDYTISEDVATALTTIWAQAQAYLK